MLTSRIKLQDQLVSVLSYPAFVFASTIAAVTVILLFVVPSLAPLVEEGGAAPPAMLGLLIETSRFLQANLILLGVMLGSTVVAIYAGLAFGWLRGPVERLLLDGPLQRTAGGLCYGAFAIALGNMLAGGAAMSEALRLALRSVEWTTARERLEPVANAVRQGETLSIALARAPRFPDAIIRLAAVGEASGALGAMLARSGRLEEEAAIRRIEAGGRILGPALIVILGGLIGMMMAGLLTGVSQLGQTALQ
jgi:type II secretory pathway component PulF